MRILLIEDNRKLSAAIIKHLKAESYAVDAAYDGLDGEELGAVNEYDVIILDVMLPGQDGWTTCAELRRVGISTPILMLTALDEIDDRVRGLDSGADDYLAKPFHFAELLARLRALARRRTEARTSEIERYGVRIDMKSHRVFRDGCEISLTAKEYALLELFMLHVDTVLSRETIVEHLWDMNYEGRSNLIETFVKLLRGKIDRGFDRRLIHTVRGAGYIFTDRER